MTAHHAHPTLLDIAGTLLDELKQFRKYRALVVTNGCNNQLHIPLPLRVERVLKNNPYNLGLKFEATSIQNLYRDYHADTGNEMQFY
ncbi:MAG: hypothetical protein AXA67_07010 [Methylothermaceae bacteria B42]|nr:MAG: hypothetical protein AXA67_07010 [Methylothermaceae bacteria B42]